MLDHDLAMFALNSFERQVLAEDHPPPLIHKHSEYQTYQCLDKSSLRLRVVRIDHPKQHKMPPLPAVVFVHGLGGQLTQFEHLIDYFSYFAPVIALDLPGHGLSDKPTAWSVYTQSNIVHLIRSVVENNAKALERGRREKEKERREHKKDKTGQTPSSDESATLPTDYSTTSFVLIGHSMGSALAIKLASQLHTVGLICLCPAIQPPPLGQSLLGIVPGLLFDYFRYKDRQGGLHSRSVSRMVSSSASDETRLRQLRWNLQVDTGAWLRTAYHFSPPTRQDWQAISCPVYLVGAGDDQVLPADVNISRALELLSQCGGACPEIESTIVPDTGHSLMVESPHVVCGLLGDFVTSFVEPKLSLSWQLAHLASLSDKWSLKNELKWAGVEGVGQPIEVSAWLTIRGMKTLRQDDAGHSPTIVERDHPEITDVVDISRESPPYDPKSFSRVIYHKFPTVSKVPPSRQDVHRFVEFVDSLSPQCDTSDKVHLAVHCHYGFNRTGFLICSYLVERGDFTVNQAIDAFARARSPGIKHPHFIDELYVRYDWHA